MILHVKSADGVEAELFFWTALFTDTKNSSLKMNQVKPSWHLSYDPKSGFAFDHKKSSIFFFAT